MLRLLLMSWMLLLLSCPISKQHLVSKFNSNPPQLKRPKGVSTKQAKLFWVRITDLTNENRKLLRHNVVVVVVVVVSLWSLNLVSVMLPKVECDTQVGPYKDTFAAISSSVSPSSTPSTAINDSANFDEPAGSDELNTTHNLEPPDASPLGKFKDFDDHNPLRNNSAHHQRERHKDPGSGDPNDQDMWVGPHSIRDKLNVVSKAPDLGDYVNYTSSASIQAEASQVPVGCALVTQRGVCITLNSIEWAIRRATDELDFGVDYDDLQSLEPREATLNAVGELVEQTTRHLARRFQLTWLEINFELEQIDLSATSLWQVCPLIIRTAPACPQVAWSRYRSHSGRCNNPFLGHLGAANMPFVRMLPPDYADSIGQPRRSSIISLVPSNLASTGTLSISNQLPPARLVTLNMHPPLDVAQGEHSMLFMSWGQLMNHDLAMASNARGATGHSDACCELDESEIYSDLASSVCMPIAIGANDPVYSQARIRCLDFKRSLSGLRPFCSLGPRTQLNVISSFVDGSFVYGSSGTASRSLRLATSDSPRARGRRGQLEMWDYFEPELGLKPLLPPQLERPDMDCVGREQQEAELYCFRSGDPRTNQQVPLVALHTVHTRQHNRLAWALEQVNPHWPSERIYSEARHIHIAMIQHVLISEYLPLLLGKSLCTRYNLTESPQNAYHDHYDPTMNPGVSQAFAAAAFRHGHSRVPSHVYRFGQLHQPLRVYRLRDLFRRPWPLFEPQAMDEFLLGLVDAPSLEMDQFMSLELTGHLLEVPDEDGDSRNTFGGDLASINVQRGRDQGVASYNHFRQWCGLGRAASFADLEGWMPQMSIRALASIYATVDDIDLFTGGSAEFLTRGAQVGPTFACIIGSQFANLRSGDRFWFESSAGPHAFTIEQLNSIKQVTLARIICVNSDNIATIQQWAMLMSHPVLNPRVHCDQLPDIDPMLWLDLGLGLG